MFKTLKTSLKHHLRLLIFMQISLKSWRCDPCHLLLLALEVLLIKNTKLKDQGYFIHLFSPLLKKKRVLKQYSLQVQYSWYFYEIQGGQGQYENHWNFLHNLAFLEYQNRLLTADDHFTTCTQHLGTLVPIVQLRKKARQRGPATYTRSYWFCS